MGFWTSLGWLRLSQSPTIGILIRGSAIPYSPLVPYFWLVAPRTAQGNPLRRGRRFDPIHEFRSLIWYHVDNLGDFYFTFTFIHNLLFFIIFISLFLPPSDLQFHEKGSPR